jgi:stress-induced-phosphoprotein 1
VRKNAKKVIKIAQDNGLEYKWSAKAYTRLSVIEEKRGNINKCITYLEESLTELNDPKIREKLKRMKKYQEEKKAKELLNPEKALELKKKGDESFKKLRWTDAIDYYSESLKRDPDNPKVYNNRSTAYCKLMAWGPALDDVSKAISLDAKWVKPYLRKSKIEQLLKTYHKALLTLKLASKVIGNNQDLLYARQHLNTAIRIANNCEDPERQQRALEDSNIQMILKDPVITALLKEAQSDPSRISNAIATDSNIRDKIELLSAAGIVR